MSTASPYRLVRAPLPPVAVPELDPSQQAVVDHAGGPLLVLAGPGTGKTTTLVEAVVERVRRGLSPEEVLVLTFCRKAADELRERIAGRLARTVSEPSAWTFHAWCLALVRAYDEGALPRLLSGPERLVRIRDLLAGSAAGEGATRWPDRLAPALHHPGHGARGRRPARPRPRARARAGRRRRGRAARGPGRLGGRGLVLRRVRRGARARAARWTTPSSYDGRCSCSPIRSILAEVRAPLRRGLRRRVPGHRPGPGAAAAAAGRRRRRPRRGRRPRPVDLRLPRRRRVAASSSSPTGSVRRRASRRRP